jgi:hypothetical protein
MSIAVGPRREQKALAKYVGELRDQFLAAHLRKGPALASPTRQEELDVAAYVVLTHGAVENFLEGLALWLVDRSEKTWTSKQRTTLSIASMLLHVPAWSGSAPSVFDNVRLAIDTAKSTLSTAIRNNNGISVDHVRDLFHPLGVDVPTDPAWTASLEMLVKLRHQWAHQYRYSARVVKSAADAAQIAQDCLKFADKLTQNVLKARP